MAPRHKNDVNHKRCLWTPTQISELRRLLTHRTPLAQIGLHLNKTEKAIRRKSERMGLSCAPTYQKPPLLPTKLGR